MTDLIKQVAESGWNECKSIRDGLKRAGLPVPTAKYLKDTFSAKHWARVERALDELKRCFQEAKFGSQSQFGVLLVPDVAKLDTRGPLDSEWRRDQSKETLNDIIDRRMGEGRSVTRSGVAWTLAATITGPQGIFMGSHNEIMAEKPARFTVASVDTRKFMVRQLWGARVLQSGADLPDSTIQPAWTFTLFPGESLVAGNASSGTILHGKVRYRLGRPDRRISSARVCPAVIVD